MNTWQIILALVVLLFIGGVRQLLALRYCVKQHELACEFLGKFIEWCNGRANDNALYDWILRKSEVLQLALGHSGLMNIRRPFESGYHTNVPILLNSIPEIHHAFHDEMFRGNSISQNNLAFSIQSVDGCLRRFIGSQEERIRRERFRLLNPAVWFGGGIAWLMELPLAILSEAGGISSHRRMAIVSSRIFSLFSGLVALASFVATAMAIVLGWETFISIITRWAQ